MPLSIVNTKPGDLPGTHTPGRAVEFGVRSAVGLPVMLQSLNVLFGHTGLSGARAVPVSGKGSTVSLIPVNGLTPVQGQASVSLGPELTITKNTSLVREAGIYRVSVPCDAQNAVLGLVRFQSPSSGEWVSSAREWTQTENVLPPFFSLAHGGAGTGLMLYLQEGSSGPPVLYMESLAREESVGSSYGYSYARRALGQLSGEPSVAVHLDPVTGMLRVFSVGPNGGLLDPLWEQRIEELGPRGAVSSEGATLCFGNAGTAGTVVRVAEWALYPDFQQAVIDGLPSPNHGMTVLPDAPYTYSPAKGAPPEDSGASSWAPVGFSSTVLNPMRSDPTVVESFSIKRDSAPAYLFRSEPLLAEREHGCMLEASISFPILSAGENLGILRIDDGSRQIVVRARSTVSGSFLVLGDQEVGFVPGGYSMVRVSVDRIRNTASLSVGGSVVASSPLSSLETTSGRPGFSVGFLGAGLPGEMKVRHLTYLNHLESWEPLAPLGPPDNFQSNTSGGSISYNDGLTVSKTSSLYGTQCTLFREMLHRPEQGFWLEFALKVNSFNYTRGATGYSNTGIGFSLNAFDRNLYLGLFECGPGGRKIGIIPGSGTEEDILRGTDLGLRFSSPVDWGQELVYRLEYIPRQAISVWCGGTRVRSAPLIIPWSKELQNFDLPVGSGDLFGISFGHFPSDFNAVTRWSFIRWGRSSGYDVGITRAYSEYPSYLFGGKFMAHVDVKTVF